MNVSHTYLSNRVDFSDVECFVGVHERGISLCVRARFVEVRERERMLCVLCLCETTVHSMTEDGHHF